MSLHSKLASRVQILQMSKVQPCCDKETPEHCNHHDEKRSPLTRHNDERSHAGPMTSGPQRDELSALAGAICYGFFDFSSMIPMSRYSA